MASNVEPEEAQAILDAVNAAPDARAGGGSGRSPSVVPRDFARPSRLGPRRLDSLAAALRRSLEDAERGLRRRLRGKTRLELVEVGEESCERALADLELPLAAMRFDVAGEPGWALWDVRGAVAAVEVALGAADSEEQPEARPLSAIERNVLAEILGSIVAAACEALGLQSADEEVVSRLEDLGSWRDGGDRADPQRFFLHVTCEGAGGSSGLRVYLPGVRPDAADADPSERADVPAHLNEVELNLSAWLGCADVPLAELLAIEVGDVIPLGVEVGEPVRIRVEDVECATARMGSHLGSLAVQIEQPLEDPRTD